MSAAAGAGATAAPFVCVPEDAEAVEAPKTKTRLEELTEAVAASKQRIAELESEAPLSWEEQALLWSRQSPTWCPQAQDRMEHHLVQLDHRHAVMVLRLEHEAALRALETERANLRFAEKEAQLAKLAAELAVLKAGT